MKKCPFCQTEYSDPSQKYCLNDGSVLVDVSATADSQATVVSPSQIQPASLQPTVAGNPGDSQGGWPATPPPYPRPSAPRRSKMPWILGGLVALLVVMGLAAVGGVVFWEFLARDTHDPDNDNKNRQIAVNLSNRSKNENNGFPTPSPVPSVNSNANFVPRLKPSPAVANVDPPSDPDEALAQLSDVETNWMKANVSGDKSTLDRILAWDYKGVLSDGSIKTKQVYLETAVPDRTVKSWSITGLTLKLNGGAATVTGTVNWVGPTGTIHFRFQDDFEWRDRRWQAVGSINLPPA